MRIVLEYYFIELEKMMFEYCPKLRDGAKKRNATFITSSFGIFLGWIFEMIWKRNI